MYVLLIFMRLLIVASSVLLLGTTGSSLRPINFDTPLAKLKEDISSWRDKLSNNLVDILAAPQTIEDLIENGPIPKEQRRYVINGWRWHTQSVIRDLDRFVSIVDEAYRKSSKISLSDQELIVGSQLFECYRFVCEFNWGGLRRVERDLFFPWFKKLLHPSNHHLFSDMLVSHDHIDKLCEEIGVRCASLSQANRDVRATRADLRSVENLLRQMRASVLKIQHTQVRKTDIAWSYSFQF